MAEQKAGRKKLGSYGRLGAMLSLIGVVLAIDTAANIRLLYKLWPLLCTVLGAGFIGIYLQRSRREAVYIGIGSFFIGFSLLALYCNFTTWAVLARLWPLFIVLPGLSMVLGFIFGRRSSIMLLLGLLLTSTGMVFLMVFVVNYRLWWTVFLFTGGSFFVFDIMRRK